MVRSKLYFQNVQTFWIGRQGRKQSTCPNLFLSILGYQVGRVDPVWTYVQTFVVFLIAGSPEAIFLDYIMQPTLVNYPRLSQATMFYYRIILGHYRVFRNTQATQIHAISQFLGYIGLQFQTFLESQDNSDFGTILTFDI